MPNIMNAGTTWMDLYALSGIAPGAAVNIQNQSGQMLYVRENAVDPYGRVVTTYQNQDCTGSPILQVRSAGGLSLFVQEL